MAGWIKMPLVTKIGLDPGHIVLDGDRAHPKKGTAPQFSVHVYWGQTVAHLRYCWTLVEFPSQKATTWLQILWNIDMIQNSKAYISVLLEATVTWSSMLVALYVLCLLIWPWPVSRSRSRDFCSSENCTLLCLPPLFGRGGDDSQPPSGAILLRL